MSEKKKVYGWLKRVGPLHGYASGEATTLCKVPMLGNNYVPPAADFERLVDNKPADLHVCIECNGAVARLRAEDEARREGA